MTLKKILIAGAAIAAFSAPALTPAHAQSPNGASLHNAAYRAYTPGIDRRLANQNRRIRRGRQNGSLVRWESRQARYGLRQIRRAKRYAARDGIVTRYERRRLHAALDRNSRQIRRLKHNRHFAGSRGFNRGRRFDRGPRFRRSVLFF